MRQGLLWLHKYTGLVLGLLLAITGLSGSLVVFDRELDEWLAPATVPIAPAATPASLDLALSNAVAAVGNGTAPTRIALGRHAGAPHIVRFPTVPGTTGPLEVSIDPGSAEVLAVRTWGQYPVTWIYHLHLSFLGGATGELVVGLLGFLLLFFSLSGLYLWWPKPGRWRQALTLRRGRGLFLLNYDLHKTAGIYFLPVYIVLAFSGINLVFHEPVERLVGALLPVQEPPAPLSGTARGQPLTVDAAAQIAREQFPGSRLNRVYLPASAEASYSITLIQPEEPWNEYGATVVWVDQYSGTVLATWDALNIPAGNTVLEWLFPLHNGDALGLPGRILVFIAGLLPALLFGTGVYMWWRKRRGRNQSRAEERARMSRPTVISR